MNKNFGGVIWTNHAISRMRERGIQQGDAWATWKNPDSSRNSKSKGTWVYYRTIGNQKIEVVAKKNENNEWIIVSVWSKIFNTSKKVAKNARLSLLQKVIRYFFGRK